MATALTPIAWQSLGSAAASVTFSSIPGTYQDLYLVINATNATASSDTPHIVINSDTTANYYRVYVTGSGSSVGSAAQINSAVELSYNTAYGLSNARINSISHFFDYATTNKHKTVLSRTNEASSGTEATAVRWANTAAITSLIISNAGSTNFAAGSTFALYGVAA